MKTNFDWYVLSIKKPPHVYDEVIFIDPRKKEERARPVGRPRK